VALFNMPAAGKCRKGVLIMKKLLLVALVPILVLGFMGCGKIEEGEPLPYFAQGAYHGEDNVADNIYFVLTPTQLTVLRSDNTDTSTLGTAAFRTGLETGDVDQAAKTIGDNDNRAELTLYGFDKGAGIQGTIQFYFADNTLYVTAVWFDERLVQTYQLPREGTYKRTDITPPTAP
jgi:hypothetical protein